MAEPSRDGARDAATNKPATGSHAQEPARGTGQLSNLAVAQHVRGGGSTADLPGMTLDNQQQQSRSRSSSSLPHRAAMERSFGRSLGHLDVRTGAGELGAMGVNALATGNRLAFRDSTPSASVVAHEVTHALQSERGSSSRNFVAPRASAAEQEADAFAIQIARRGPGARLPRPSAAPAGQVHLDQPGWKTSFSFVDQKLLADWIQADTPAPPPKFNPSLAQFDRDKQMPTWLNGSPGGSPMGNMPSSLSDADQRALVQFIDAAPGAKNAAPKATPNFGTGMPSSFSDADGATIAKWIQNEPGKSPSAPMTGFPSPLTSDPLAHTSDPFVPQADPFKPKYDSSVCHTNIHGVVYKRMAPPAPAAPTWSAPDAATGQAAVKKEVQSTDETADQIDLQVLSAKAAAISAAAAKGKLPADLQQLWQEATLNAEALRLASPPLSRAKPGASATPPPSPKPAAPKPVDPAAPPVPEIDTATAEATRTAIDAFYWSLADALQVKEAEADAFAQQWNAMHATMKAKPPPYQTNCHAAPSDDFQWEQKAPPPKQSPFVKAREKLLAKAASVAEWKGVLNDFDVVSTVTLEDLVMSILPPDAKELKQLKYATELRDRIRDLRTTQGDAVRIPAVFYPENDLATETGTDGKSVTKPQGYSWYLFLYKRPDGYFVLKDLTSGREFTNTEGEGQLEGLIRERHGVGASGVLADYPEAVMQRLIGQLNSSLHMPKGVLHYTLPGGRQRALETTEPWELSDWLRAIGLTLAAIGVIALTGGAGTAAGIAFVGAGLAGAASSKAALEEMEKQGIATDSDRARAYLNIAVDLIGALAGGVGMIARAPSTFGQLAMIADRVYIPLRAAAATGELAQAALMTHDFVQNLQALAAQPDSKERTTGIVKLIGMAVAMGALTFVSLRGAVHEIGSGARPSVIANGDGTYSLVGPSPTFAT